MNPFNGTRRPLLIFNHNPKAGGGTLLDTFRGFKKQCGENWRREDFLDNSSCFVYIRELKKSDRKDRERGFVISSIREPCSHYLSLWAYGSAGHGGFFHNFINKTGGIAYNSYGQDAPYFNSSADVDRFNTWLRSEDVFGILQRRMMTSYGLGRPEVDCWVFVEDFHASFLDCLEMYEDQGGEVDWNSRYVADLVSTVEKKQNHDQARRFLPSKTGKNDVTGNPQHLHHASCDTYFDPSTKAMIEFGPEAGIYKMFAYQGCCKKENGWMPIMKHKRFSYSSFSYELKDSNGIASSGPVATEGGTVPCHWWSHIELVFSLVLLLLLVIKQTVFGSGIHALPHPYRYGKLSAAR